MLKFLLFLMPLSAFAANQHMVLSGGDNPSGNNYSQYLQTKAMATYLRTAVAPNSVQVYFGAGNSDLATTSYYDVHKTLKSGEISYSSLIPGLISGNHAATKENVQDYFASAPENMSKSDTFFLFVSDHGMPNHNAMGTWDTTYSNNCVNLWNFDMDTQNRKYAFGEFQHSCLSKDELKQLIKTQVPAQKTVFAMTQCYSGGFHQMSVQMKDSYPTADVNLCGFTAVPHDTFASGCTPDVDGPGYQGYERSFTQQLSGYNFVTGQKIGEARRSLLEAHRAAVADDMTMDIPLSTSDYYLWQWAQVIENKNFKPRNNNMTAEKMQGYYLSTADKKIRPPNDDKFQSYAQFVGQVAIKIAKTYPDLNLLVQNGTMMFLKAKEKDLNKQMEDSFAEGDKIDAQAQPLIKKIKTAWSAAVAQGQVPLTDAEKSAEAIISMLEVTYPGVANRHVLAYLAMDSVSRPEEYQTLMNYQATRKDRMRAWALKQSSLSDAQAVLDQLVAAANEWGTKNWTLIKEHGVVRRILIYRQVMGAWGALKFDKDTQAMHELSGLQSCEATQL